MEIIKDDSKFIKKLEESLSEQRENINTYIRHGFKPAVFTSAIAWMKGDERIIGGCGYGNPTLILETIRLDLLDNKQMKKEDLVPFINRLMYFCKPELFDSLK